jgi:hypothetical protein
MSTFDSETIPDRLMEVMEHELAPDGFTRPSPHIFVKQIANQWRAWICIDTGRLSLTPMVGIIGDELIDIHVRARALMGIEIPRGPAGPPVIMASFEALAKDCHACSAGAPWHFTGEFLKMQVATDLVECLRKYAYPFFAAHSSLETVFQAYKTGIGGAGGGSIAFPFFAPIILIELGQLDDLMRYVEHRVRKPGYDEARAADYREYVSMVQKILLG